MGEGSYGKCVLNPGEVLSWWEQDQEVGLPAGQKKARWSAPALRRLASGPGGRPARGPGGRPLGTDREDSGRDGKRGQWKSQGLDRAHRIGACCCPQPGHNCVLKAAPFLVRSAGSPRESWETPGLLYPITTTEVLTILPRRHPEKQG